MTDRVEVVCPSCHAPKLLPIGGEALAARQRNGGLCGACAARAGDDRVFNVLSPLETLHRILSGRLGLSRFGDGEQGLAVCESSARGQEYVPSLGKALRKVARAQIRGLLVAIPDIFRHIPPEKFRWARWATPERTRIFDPEITYGNAFVSRPDFWGEPFGPEYWATMRQIWDGRPVLLVAGSEKRPALFDNAASIDLCECPARDAWASYHDILARCLEWAGEHPDGVIVAQAGPTATVLAFDCARHGVQCLDLGKASRFYRDEMRETPDRLASTG